MGCRANGRRKPDNIRQNEHSRKGMTSPTNRQNRKAPQVTAQYSGYNPPTKNEHSAEPTPAFILYRAGTLKHEKRRTIQDNMSSRRERTAQRDKWSPPTIPQALTKSKNERKKQAWLLSIRTKSIKLTFYLAKNARTLAYMQKLLYLCTLICT